MMWMMLMLGCGLKTNPTKQTEKQVDTFEVVWKTVKDAHPDPDMNGIDWQAIHDELLPQARKAKTPEDLRPILEDMIHRLEVSHYGVLPGEVYEQVFPDEDVEGQNPGNTDDEPDATDDITIGTVGIYARWVDEELIIIDSEGAAAKAGITPGWRLTTIDEEPVTKIAERVQILHDSPQDIARVIALSAQGRLQGTVGASISLGLRDPDGAEHQKTLTLLAGEGEPVQLGHLPPIRVRFEHERLDDNVHRIAFDVFMVTIAAPMEAAMTRIVAEDAAGVILDLRGNPGGVAGLGQGIAGYFFQTRGQALGTMITRENELNLVIFPRPPAQNYDGPLAVVVDELSFSTSEILAAGLQAHGRAQVFGTPTSGLALPSTVMKLPNGDRFQYVVADLVAPDGQRIEGAGVTPDTIVLPDPDQLAVGVDPALQAARRWILSQQPMESP